MATDEKKPFGIDFIDPLFAVAISIGFTEGIMKEQWFRDWYMPKGDDTFNLFVFGLGFLTIVLSWLGYHESIKTKPLHGIGRFILDVLLVMVYAVLMVKFRDLGAVLFLIAIIYLLYILWDLFKVNEYPKQYKKEEKWWKRYRRELVTVVWFFIFALIWVIYIFGALNRETLLISAYVSIGLYRVNKGVDIWGVLRDALSKLWAKLSNVVFGERE